MGGELLTIGAFARQARLSTKALRLYDRLGLLVPNAVDPVNGYRRYDADALPAARLIVQLRRLGMPLTLVAEVLAAGAEGDGGHAAAARVEAFWAGVEDVHASRRELARRIAARMIGTDGGFAMYEIEERDVPEQLVLTEQRHVRTDELAAWLEESFTRLFALADKNGRVAAPYFIVYHGEVNEDSDGPAEVCVPVDPAMAGALGGHGVRVEPAHRELFTRLVKAQVVFPEIMSAYDAVSEAVRARGLRCVGGPREVYHGYFPTAAPDDQVCDVAFPVH